VKQLAASHGSVLVVASQFTSRILTGLVVAFFAIVALDLGVALVMHDPLPAPDPDQVRGMPGIAGMDAQRTEPELPQKPLLVLQPVHVERVDCLKKGAPNWCHAMKYATDGERKGTMVAILRSDEGGEVHWCNNDKYISAVGVYASQEIRDALKAVTVTLEPRDAKPVERYRYFLVPPDMDTSSWEWLGPCPFKG
jgi:hypothetical protein